jgi:hypothetical protein
MPQETYFVKVVGKANIPNKLSIGHNWKINIDASITQEQKDDNEDGTFSITYKAEPITMEVIADNGQITKARDTRKNSTKIRNLLYFKWKELNEPIDFEEYYTKFTNTVLSNMDALIKMK